MKTVALYYCGKHGQKFDEANKMTKLKTATIFLQYFLWIVINDM